MIETLEQAGAGTAIQATGTYYKTVLGTIQHCLWYEVSWLRRCRALGNHASLRAALLDEELDSLKAKVVDDVSMVTELLREIDALYVAFVGEAGPEDLLAPIRFKNFRGEEEERIAWRTGFQVLNEALHPPPRRDFRCLGQAGQRQRFRRFFQASLSGARVRRGVPGPPRDGPEHYRGGVPAVKMSQAP